MSTPATPIRPSVSSPGLGRAPFAETVPARNRFRLLLPREHGAWGLVSLPFLAAAVVGGHWLSARMAAAAVAVFAVFLLREPLAVLWRNRAAAIKYGVAPRPNGEEKQAQNGAGSARFSIFAYGATATAAGAYLALTLPLAPLLILGGGAVLLTLIALYCTVRNYQRHPALQIASVFGLTASSLLAYLAARGYWDAAAFWIWGLSAAHGTTAVLVVHARLEAMIATRRSGSASTSEWRTALLAQAGVIVLAGALAAMGRPWLSLPFLPPLLLHVWELWQFRCGLPPGFSMRRVGWTQLGASIAFCFLLIAVLL